MADYTEIKGNRVQYLDSDPTLTSANEGQVWYNTATGTLKGLVQLQAWSSGAPLITAKARYTQGGAGTQTAALAIGGWISSSTTQTEEYNGSGWSQGGALGTARYGLYTAGTQTAAFAATGKTPPVTTATEEYDGTTWTAGGVVATERFLGGSSGTLTAGLIHGGRNSANTANLNNTEEYNGTSWTAGGNLNAARNTPFSSGSQTAALAAGGGAGGGNTAVGEHYDGSAWTTVNSMNTERRSGAPSISGTQTSSLAFGGFTTTMVTNTESYDGTNWSNSPTSLGTARYGLGGAGTGNAALAFGGQNNGGTQYTNTEEYNSSVNVITGAAWASGGNYPSSLTGITSMGPRDANLSTGGNPASTTTAEYDGSAWTAGGALNTGRRDGAAGGTQTAGLFFGGTNSSPSSLPGSQTVTEEYDGTSWASNPTGLSTGRFALSGFGLQTAGVAAAGTNNTGTNQGITEEYDGSTWTAGGAIPARQSARSTGILTAGILSGGNNGPMLKSTLLYDGTSWTSDANMNANKQLHGCAGTQTATLVYTGSDSEPRAPGINAISEQYNGIAWATAPSVATARHNGGGSGTQPAAILVGGTTAAPASSNATEEFTGETSTATASTLTTS